MQRNAALVVHRWSYVKTNVEKLCFECMFGTYVQMYRLTRVRILVNLKLCTGGLTVAWQSIVEPTMVNRCQILGRQIIFLKSPEGRVYHHNQWRMRHDEGIMKAWRRSQYFVPCSWRLPCNHCTDQSTDPLKYLTRCPQKLKALLVDHQPIAGLTFIITHCQPWLGVHPFNPPLLATRETQHGCFTVGGRCWTWWFHWRITVFH